MKHAPEYYPIVALAKFVLWTSRLMRGPGLALALFAVIGFHLFAQQNSLAEQNVKRIEAVERTVSVLDQVAAANAKHIIDFGSPLGVTIIGFILGSFGIAVGAIIRLGTCVNGHGLQIRALLKDSNRRADKLASIDKLLTKAAVNLEHVETSLGKLCPK